MTPYAFCGRHGDAEFRAGDLLGFIERKFRVSSAWLSDDPLVIFKAPTPDDRYANPKVWIHEHTNRWAGWTITTG